MKFTKIIYTVFVFSLIAFSIQLYAEDQNQVRIYFDKQNRQVGPTYNWTYFRLTILNKFHRSEGPVIDKWRNGVTKAKGICKNGLESGPWIYFHSNGAKEKQGVYKNGLRVGKWQFWHDNGKLDREGNYINGLVDGLWTFYHKNGVKKAEGIYKMGKYVRNTWKRWDDSGKLKEEY